MPGIVGIIEASESEKLHRRVESMLKRMMHDPGYRSGMHIQEKLGLWSGWVAREGSSSGRMPVWNETREICLIFSGEEFAEPR